MKVSDYIFFVVLVICPGVNCFGGDAEGVLTAKTRWTNLYSEDNWTDESPRLIRIGRDEYYAVGTSRFRNKKGSYDYKLWIWRLDSEGNRIWSKAIDASDIGEEKEVVGGDLLCPANERLIVVRKSARGTGTWLIRFDEAGEVSFVKKLALGNEYYVLRNIACTKDGYLISGQKIGNNTDAWVLKIDSNGEQLWQKTYDKGKSENAMSMAAAEGGGFTLAANSGEYNKFGGGESAVWVFKCDSMGNVLAETLFPGRHPTIAVTTAGTYAVSYNTADVPSVELYITGLDKELNHIWKTGELYKGDGLGMYKLATDGKDNFIVAGTKFSEVWLWKIDDKGRQIWSIPINNDRSVVHVESLLVNDKEYILAGSAGISRTVRRKEDVPRDLFDILIAKVIEVNSD